MSAIPDEAVTLAAEALCVIHCRPAPPPMADPDNKDPRNRIAACYRCQAQAPAALVAALPALMEWAATEIEADRNEVASGKGSSSVARTGGRLWGLNRAAALVRSLGGEGK